MNEHKHVIKFDVKTYPCECGLEFSQELAETLVEAALRGSLPTVQLGIDLEFEKRRVAELQDEILKAGLRQGNYIKELHTSQDRIAELEESQRWIPVGERLPEDRLNVLTVSRGGLIISCFIDEYKMWYAPCADRLNVTHWMPLPEPPEVQE